MALLKRFLIAGCSAVLMGQGVEAATLEEVRAKGHLDCGVSHRRLGFAVQEPDGRWIGLDVDTCRAVAAATLGDAGKVTFTVLSAKEKFTVLQSGGVDLLAHVTTWTLSRDVGLELNFAGINFYDAQAFMVRKDLDLRSVKDLDGAVICVTIGTTTELNLSDFFKSNNMSFQPIRYETPLQAIAEYELGRCDALTGDRTALAAFRSEFKDPTAHVILPEVISKEPLGPVVRHGDDKWLDIVKWTIFVLLQAEELGVTSANVDEFRSSDDPTIQHLLGVSGDLGQLMGLSNDWGYQIIKQVGNFGEIYERNVGRNTRLGLERGLNAQWTQGGLLYAMPIR